MSDDTQTGTRTHSAGAFDVRSIIGALLSVYGLILLLTGLFADTDADKTGDINANLWAGIVLLVVGAGFVAWWRLRPIVVPETDGHGERPPQH